MYIGARIRTTVMMMMTHLILIWKVMMIMMIRVVRMSLKRMYCSLIQYHNRRHYSIYIWHKSYKQLQESVIGFPEQVFCPSVNMQENLREYISFCLIVYIFL